MIRKKAAVGIDGRDKLVKGANFIADAVKTTFGPGGQNFAIEKGERITNDGLTIARELLGSQEDEIEERGAKILVDGVSKANDEVGDGSTTATVLTQAILKEAIKQLPSKARITGLMTATQLIKKVEQERLEITEQLKEMATAVDTEEQLINVAKVSVENDELGTLIGQTQWKLGKDGVIIAEEVNQKECSVEFVQGLLLDNGFGSQAVINNEEKEALEVKDVSVIYTNHTVSINDFSQNEQGQISALAETVTSLVKMGRKKIVIMARAFTQEAITHCLSQAKSGLELYPLNAPYTDQAQIMEDLQAVIGGRFINVDTDSLDSLQVSDVGFATHVLAKRMSTVFTGHGLKTAERVVQLEKKREGSPSDFEKRSLDTRIAQLTNGFALLKIGANSVAERKYLKDKADDAVNAVKAAFQEGVVPGAGQALNTIAESLPDTYILKNAIMAPHREIRYNAGEDFTVPEWVVDSVKVTRVALEKACSVAGILATAAGAIVTKRKKECDCNHNED